MLWVVQQTEIAREQTMILELAGRTQRYLEKAGQFGVSVPAGTLRDVRWDGGAGRPHLAYRPIQRVPRELRRGSIYLQRQQVALFQTFKSLTFHIGRSPVSGFRSL